MQSDAAGAVVAAAGLPGLAARTGRHLPTILHLIRGGSGAPRGRRALAPRRSLAPIGKRGW